MEILKQSKDIDRSAISRLPQWISAFVIFTLSVILFGLSWTYFSTLATLQTRVGTLEQQYTDYEKSVQEYIDIKIKEALKVRLQLKDIQHPAPSKNKKQKKLNVDFFLNIIIIAVV